MYFWSSANRFWRKVTCCHSRLNVIRESHGSHIETRSHEEKMVELSTYRNSSSVGGRDFYNCSTLNEGNDFSCFWRTRSLLWNASCTSQQPMPTLKLDVLHLHWKYYQSCLAKWLMQMGMTHQVCSFDYERNLTLWVRAHKNSCTSKR